MQGPSHHPTVMRTEDSGWVVMCRDCLGDQESSVPVGIGLAVTSLFAAELMRDNHVRQTGLRDISRYRPSEPSGFGQPLDITQTRPQRPSAVA